MTACDIGDGDALDMLWEIDVAIFISAVDFIAFACCLGEVVYHDTRNGLGEGGSEELGVGIVRRWGENKRRDGIGEVDIDIKNEVVRTEVER